MAVETSALATHIAFQPTPADAFQVAAIAILVADSLFGEDTTLIVMTYALIMFTTTSLVAIAFRALGVSGMVDPAPDGEPTHA